MSLILLLFLFLPVYLFFIVINVKMMEAGAFYVLVSWLLTHSSHASSLSRVYFCRCFSVIEYSAVLAVKLCIGSFLQASGTVYRRLLSNLVRCLPHSSLRFFYLIFMREKHVPVFQTAAQDSFPVWLTSFPCLPQTTHWRGPSPSHCTCDHVLRLPVKHHAEL
jgi:hypothetical protein